MDFDRPLKTRSITPDEALEILREVHRQVSAVDPECDPDAEVTSEMTVAEWSIAMDLISDFGDNGSVEFLNWIFRSEIRPGEWKRVLQPDSVRTLGDVCAFVASQTQVEGIEPILMLGKPCLSAGAFLAVRNILAREGADVSKLAPSSLLEPFLWKCRNAFACHIPALAPGRLPTLELEYDSLLKGWRSMIPLVGLILLGAGAFAARWMGPNLAYLGLFLISAGLLVAMKADLPPRSVKYGDLKTFRDLVRTMLEAGQNPAPAR